MTWIGCEEATWWLTTAIQHPEVSARLRELRDRGASSDEYITALVCAMEPEVAEVATRELRQLPSLTTVTLIEAWAMADRANKRFELVSQRPAKPITFARERRVSLALDVDNEGVKVTISHIANRHADWYAPKS